VLVQRERCRRSFLKSTVFFFVCFFLYSFWPKRCCNAIDRPGHNGRFVADSFACCNVTGKWVIANADGRFQDCPVPPVGKTCCEGHTCEVDKVALWSEEKGECVCVAAGRPGVCPLVTTLGTVCSRDLQCALGEKCCNGHCTQSCEPKVCEVNRKRGHFVFLFFCVFSFQTRCLWVCCLVLILLGLFMILGDVRQVVFRSVVFTALQWNWRALDRDVFVLEASGNARLTAKAPTSAHPGTRCILWNSSWREVVFVIPTETGNALCLPVRL
jgi:hypothetical protein